MDWVKLATRYFADPKITGLPDADTELMFVRSLARAGELGDGGFIPEADLGLLARRRRLGSCIKALVDAGLWSPVDGGYRITAWADWQSAADALAARRKADRERQRKRRSSETTTLSRDIGNLSRDVTDPEGEGELERDSSGYVGREGGAPPARARETPPRTCPKHKDDPSPPACWACKAAREAYEQWEAEQSKPPPKPTHCGQCSETRHIELTDGRQARCPRCHPGRIAT